MLMGSLHPIHPPSARCEIEACTSLLGFASSIRRRQGLGLREVGVQLGERGEALPGITEGGTRSRQRLLRRAVTAGGRSGRNDACKRLQWRGGEGGASAPRRQPSRSAVSIGRLGGRFIHEHWVCERTHDARWDAPRSAYRCHTALTLLSHHNHAAVTPLSRHCCTTGVASDAHLAQRVDD